MAQSTVATVDQLIEAYGLGAQREEYHFKITRTLLGGLLLIALGAAPIAFIVISGQMSTAMDFSALNTSGDFWLFGIIGLVLFAGGIWTLIKLFLNSNRRVIVYEQGVVRMNKSLTEVVRWEDVDTFLQAVTKHYINGIYTNTTHIYTLCRSNGKAVKFGDTIRKVEALGDTLQREVTRVLLPKFIEAYNMGDTLTFGPLSMSQEGLSNGKEMLSWSQVQDVQVRQGIVSVQKEDQWTNWSPVGIARIPNFYAFMALVDSVLKEQA